MSSEGAYTLRETTGTSGVAKAARAAAEIFSRYEIPHLIAGGLAVQEHGYYRVTIDVDIIVPGVLDALEVLTADFSGPFDRVAGLEHTVRDRRHDVLINLLPAGKVFKQGCRVPFPSPETATAEPAFVTLEELVSLKLDSWSNTPVRRLKDKSDVIELIIQRRLPRDLAVDAAVRRLYEETWDALQAEDSSGAP